jgi:Helix-turn-helix domain
MRRTLPVALGLLPWACWACRPGSADFTRRSATPSSGGVAMRTSYRHVSLEERCELAQRRAAGQSIRQIAAALDRAPSSISRELKRNGGRQARYRRRATPPNWPRPGAGKVNAARLLVAAPPLLVARWQLLSCWANAQQPGRRCSITRRPVIGGAYQAAWMALAPAAGGGGLSWKRWRQAAKCHWNTF